MAGDSHDHGPPPPPPASALTNNNPSPLARTVAKIPYIWINPLCGSLAGVASGVVTCPLDVIKTKLQAQGSFRQQRENSRNQASGSAVYRGLLGTARTIIQQDGLKGMYRGLGPMMIGYIPTWAVYMGVYDTSKGVFSDYFSKFNLSSSCLYSFLPISSLHLANDFLRNPTCILPMLFCHPTLCPSLFVPFLVSPPLPPFL